MVREKVLLFVLLCCCGFNNKGILESETVETSGFTDGEESEDGTEGPSSTSATTAPATTSSSGTSPTTTTDATEESSDASTDESSSDESGEQTSSESSETGEPLPDYGPCSMANDAACESPADTCVWTDGVDDGINPAGWCARECNTADDCPSPETGTATVDCTYYGEMPLKCVLKCNDGKECPDGMVCLVHMYTPEFGNEYDHMCAWST